MTAPQTHGSQRQLPHEAGGEPLISVRGVRVSFKERRVLDGVDLDIYKGETMVILGASGCGKTTLLRRLEGLEKPDQGSIRIAGVDIVTASREKMEEVRRLLGVSFQSAALFGSMTVGENIALPLLEHTELAESTIRLMTKMKLQQVGLEGAEDLYPTELSGGMRKRASLARALAMDPQILLFDEPSAGLDPIIATGIDQLIIGLKQTYTITIIVVTHELQSAFLIADRICVLDQGRVLAVGPVEHILNHSHPRIQQFVKRVPDTVERGSSSYITGFE